LGAVDPRSGGQEDARPASVPYLGVPLASGRPLPFSPPWQTACGHPSFRPAPLPPSTCLPACLMCLPPSSRLSSAVHVVLRSFFLPYVLSHALPAILVVGCSVAVPFAAPVYARLTVDMPASIGRYAITARGHAGQQSCSRRTERAPTFRPSIDRCGGRLAAGKARSRAGRSSARSFGPAARDVDDDPTSTLPPPFLSIHLVSTESARLRPRPSSWLDLPGGRSMDGDEEATRARSTLPPPRLAAASCLYRRPTPRSL
jgi:hypothetical protein